MNSCCELLSNPQTFVCEKNAQKMLLQIVNVCLYMCLFVCVCVCVCVCVYVTPVFWRAETGKPSFFWILKNYSNAFYTNPPTPYN